MKEVAHWWWNEEYQSFSSCGECVHYCHKEGYTNLNCLACGHAYGADTKEDMNEMDYPKSDLYLSYNDILKEINNIIDTAKNEILGEKL